MADATYTPGTWVGVIRSGTVVLLGPGTSPALAGSLWELLGETPEVHEVLHAVTSGFGGSLAEIPWFGIVDYRDSLRVFLRGDLDLSVQLVSGPVELNGRDVTTWTERRLADPQWYRLTVAGAGQPGAVLPLAEGVVLLQSLTVALGTEPVPEPAAPQHASEEVSAETVMAVLDDDSTFDAEVPEAVHNESPASFPDQVPAHELTGSYDHLWEKTVVRRIEDAAVRDQPDADEPHEAEPVAGEPASAEPGAAEPASPEPKAAEPAEAEPAAGSLSVAPPAPGVGGLIDSVPWRTGGSSARADEAKPSFNFLPAPAAGPAAEDSREAHTQAPVSGPAVPPPAPLPVPPAGFDPDHDGETIMKSDLNIDGVPAGAAAGAAAAAGEPDAAVGPLVLARVCSRGHANPPTHAQCALCASSLPADAVQVARPRLGRMRVSTGELVDLDQSLVIGRQPSVSRVQGGGMPRLVQVASPSGDISRSHVEVRLEGWHVMLCDLKATNGTVLVRDGQQPRRLAQNEMAILLDGDIAELGDDISLRFEEIL